MGSHFQGNRAKVSTNCLPRSCLLSLPPILTEGLKEPSLVLCLGRYLELARVVLPPSPPMSGRCCVAPACRSCRLQSAQPFSPQTGPCCWPPVAVTVRVCSCGVLPPAKAPPVSGHLCRGLRSNRTLLWSQHISGSECECLLPTTSREA